MPPKTIPFSDAPQTIPFGQEGEYETLAFDVPDNQSLASRIWNDYYAKPLKTVATGVGKAVAEIGFGVGELGTTIGRTLLPKELEPQKPTIFEQPLPESLKAEGIGENIGKVIGTVAPYFIGIGEAKAVEGAATFIPKLAEKIGMSVESFIPKVAQYLSQKFPTLLKNFAIGAAQTGELEKGGEVAVGGEIIGAGGKVIKAVGKEAYKGLAIPVSAIEAKLLQTYKASVPFIKRMGSVIAEESKAPITAAETAFRKGFIGTESMIGVQAKKASSSLWKNLIEPALKRSPQKTNISQFFDDAEQIIRNENPELTRQNSLIEALSSIRDDYKKVEEVTDLELQRLKEGFAKFVPEKFYKGKPIAGAVNEVRAKLARLARTKIYNSVGPEAKQAYLDYGNLLGLQELGQKAMTGGKLKGGFGSFWSAVKDMVLTPVATIGGQTIYKVGQGIEITGAPDARYLSDLFDLTPPSQ